MQWTEGYILLQPTLYIDWAKQLCNPYAIITLHEVKDICAANKLLPHVAAARTNYGLSIHQRNKGSIYPC